MLSSIVVYSLDLSAHKDELERGLLIGPPIRHDTEERKDKDYLYFVRP